MSVESHGKDGPRAGPAGAALVALAATSLVAALTDRNRYWRFEAALSSVASLVCAILVCVFRDREWLPGVVRWPLLLAVLAGGRLHMRTAGARRGATQVWFGVRLYRRIYDVMRAAVPRRLLHPREA